MSTDFLPALQPINIESLASSSNLASSVATTAPTVNGTSFGELVSKGLQTVNQQLQASHVDLQRLASGDAGNLHQVMLKLEESRMSFQLMLQVRNRLLESYQEIMRMQV